MIFVSLGALVSENEEIITKKTTAFKAFIPVCLFAVILAIEEFLAVSEYDAFLQSRFGENYLSELPNGEKRKPSHNTNIRIFE